MRRVTTIDKDICKLQAECKQLQMKIKELQKERAEAVKARQLDLDEDMVDLLTIIMKNPGSSKEDIQKQMSVSKEDYNNKMTTLRRRKLIVNEGTRTFPEYYASFGRP